MNKITVLTVAVSLLAVQVLALAEERLGITQRLIFLEGDDGQRISAFLLHSDKGFDPYAPGIVLHHGGPGGHGARKIGAARFAAERWAAAGYNAVSIISRTANGYVHMPLYDVVGDVGAAVDFLADQGAEDIILAGHSMGSVSISIYQTQTNDPRVKAMIHFAPTADLYAHAAAQPDAEEHFETARSLLADNNGDLTPEFQDGSESDGTPEIFATAYGRPQTAEAFLGWWGPDANTSNSELFRELRVPQLLLAGTEDGFVPQGRMAFLKEQASLSPRVDYIWYQGGDHYFTGFQDESAQNAVDWLEEVGLPPTARISTRFFDNAVEIEGFGVVNYPGIAYEPTEKTLDDVAVVILHDWRDNIMEGLPHSLAYRIAQQGITVLTPQLRSSGLRGSLDSALEIVEQDMLAWSQALSEEGFSKIILVGHGVGAFWAAVSRDVPGVEQLVLLSPPGDLQQHLRSSLGDRAYEALVDRAQSQDPREILVKRYAAPRGDDPFDGLILQYPPSFLAYWAAEDSSVADELAKADMPVTVFAAPTEYYAGEADLAKSFDDKFSIQWIQTGLEANKQRLASSIATLAAE